MRKILVVLVVAGAVAIVGAQEKVTLTSPVYVDAGASEFRVAALDLNRRGSEIRAIFGEVQPGTATFVSNGKTLLCLYSDAQADTLLIALNKANLSIKSLERRVTEQCQSDGKLGAGTISGVPQ